MSEEQRTPTKYVSIRDKDGNIVQVTPAGGIVIDGSVTGSVDLTQFRAKVLQSASEINLSAGVDTTLVEVNDEGKIDFIAVKFDDKKAIVILEVDDIEVYRLETQLLDLTYALKSSNPYDLIHSVTDKDFRDVYFEGADFNQGFKIKATMSSGNGKATAYLIKYRGKI